MRNRITIAAASLLAVVFCSPESLGAQSRIGIVAGSTMSKLNVQPRESFTGKTGLVVGLFYDQAVGDYAAFSIRGLYNQRGATADDLEIALNYLETDYCLKVFAGHEQAAVYLMAGPRVGLLIDASGYLRSNNLYGDVSHLFQRYDIGYSAGLGVRYGPVFIEGSYNGSLMNIYNDNSIRVLNQGVQLAAGVSIPIGF